MNWKNTSPKRHEDDTLRNHMKKHNVLELEYRDAKLIQNALCYALPRGERTVQLSTGPMTIRVVGEAAPPVKGHVAVSEK